VKRALITGAAGFVGQWLGKSLLSDGWSVHGTSITGLPTSGALSPDALAAINWHHVDLRLSAEVGRVLDEAQPDAIFHLAGVTFVPSAHDDPGGAWDSNVRAAEHMMAHLVMRRAAGVLDPIVVIAGSGEEYGAHDATEMPLKESAPLRPVSVYAVTKAAQEMVALAAWREHGVRVIATRPFNHSGPGQAVTFLLPALVARAREAAANGAPHIRIGNPDPVRDFLHVSDVVRAYISLADAGGAGEVYNISSGTGVSVRELADCVLAAAGARAELEVDASLVRAVDVPVLIGDPSKLMARTGWRPVHSLTTLIDDLVHAAAN
jgi:GDP-4-dehydro-6-deoxy-D-mannose reductase